MSNFQKRDRSGELGQSGLKVNPLRLGNFHTYIRKKDARTSPFVFILSSENSMYCTEIETLSYLQSILIWTVFSYQIQEMTVKGEFLSIPQRRFVQEAPCSLNLVFRRKLCHDFISGILVLLKGYVLPVSLHSITVCVKYFTLASQ